MQMSKGNLQEVDSGDFEYVATCFYQNLQKNLNCTKGVMNATNEALGTNMTAANITQ